MRKRYRFRNVCVAKSVWIHLNGCGESCHLPCCWQWSCANLTWRVFGGSDPNSPFCPWWILNFSLWNFFPPFETCFGLGFSRQFGCFGVFFPNDRDSRDVSSCVTELLQVGALGPWMQRAFVPSPFFRGDFQVFSPCCDTLYSPFIADGGK